MKALSILFFSTLSFSLLSSGSTFYQQASLIELRQECDSLKCPERYTYAYRLLAEDLQLPLKDRFKYLEISEKISLELTDFHEILSIYAQAGRMYRDQGQFAASMEAFSKGIHYLGYKNNTDWLHNEGWFLVGYGNLLFQVKLFEDAQDIFRNCALVMEKNRDDYGEAVAYNNIGLCYSQLGRPDSALFYFNKAYELRLGLNDKFLLTHSLLYISQMYRELGNGARADSALEKAAFYNDLSTEFEFIGDIHCQWAEIAFDHDDLISASYHLSKAKEMSSPFKDFNWLNLKIRLFTELRLEDSLLVYIDSAISTAQKFGNLDRELSLLYQKENLYRKKGQIKKADSILVRIAALSQKLLIIKDTVQKDLMEVQGEFIVNRSRLQNLEASNKEKERIIASQNTTIILVTIMALILLSAFILYYRINNRVRKLSKNLRIINERSRLAAEQMTSGIIALDANGDLIFSNQAARDHFRYFGNFDLEESKNFLSQINQEAMLEDWQLRIQEVQQKKSFQNMSSRLKDERKFYHLVSLREMISEGQMVGTVAVITDVTNSQERSLELSRKTQALEIANSAKEKMLSLLAHDLKEGVVSSLELAKLSLDGDPKEHNSNLQLIYESLARTKTLLFKTLDWVKHQSNGLELQRNKFFIARLVNDVIKEKEDIIKQKSVECLNQVDQDLQAVADPNALRVILRNLIGNAIKFVEPKVGRVQIQSRRINSAKIEIAIVDNGRGMTPVQIANLLGGEKLNSTKGTIGEEGTGMGLHFCQDLLFKMGSTLQVESSLNLGTVFYFSLDCPQGAAKQ
ncbi:ATP-binding protein [Croceimicrobium hydrocarbonivorans]|uniref:histidine kinase n=1 Tax=Croceimicrobium hydrocarbonivorans TaxID=2761580 RepID=A0A7H0VE56_9FLAO|nr:ATP-binding protein [Croceimicrobium hydrocarbonivorans]QNR24004.1 tetratricopeptide repeat-containing sensor histidine kinase [Croceimicrobium hydrocarbonivorans]